jgi:hypothetical protein
LRIVLNSLAVLRLFVSTVVATSLHNLTTCFPVTLRDQVLYPHKRDLLNSIVFGPETEEDGSWRKLQNDELHSLYSSPNIVRVIKSRRLRWAGHVARRGKGRGVYRVLHGRPEGKETTGKT